MDHVFILGSGFSKAIDARMPTLKELSADVRTRFGDGWDSTWGEDLQQNVELLLTYLAARHPWDYLSERYRALGTFFDVRDLVVDLIEEAQAATVGSLAEPPTWLWDLIDYWDATKSTVITFNYDVLVELAYSKRRDGPGLRSPRSLYPSAVSLASERLGGLRFHAEHHETFVLLKPHGSLSWYFSGPDGPPGDTVYWDGMYGWRPPPPPSERVLGDKERMIVPPLLEKTSFYANDLLRRQWTLAREAITRADRITCIGYSLPVTDLTVRFLLSTSSPSLDVEIVDANEELDRHYMRMLPGSNIVVRSAGDDAVSRYTESLD